MDLEQELVYCLEEVLGNNSAMDLELKLVSSLERKLGFQWDFLLAIPRVAVWGYGKARSMVIWSAQ
jgi:hypothetical protein